MSAIGPGDFVEAVSGLPDDGAPAASGYRFGGVYCVDEVGMWRAMPWLNCAGMKRPGDVYTSLAWAPGWNARCFRLVYRPKASLIESLKQPAPAEPDRVDA